MRTLSTCVFIWLVSLVLWWSRVMGDEREAERPSALSAAATPSDYHPLQASISSPPENLDASFSSTTSIKHSALLTSQHLTAASSAISHAPSAELKTRILQKRLTPKQLMLLTNGDKQDMHDDVNDGSDDAPGTFTLQTVDFAGISQDFATVLRKLHSAAVQESSSLPLESRHRRQAQRAVEAEIVNIQRDGTGTAVTLDFILEQNGDLVAMETALEKLQQLSPEEMEVMSPLKVVKRTADQALPLSAEVLPTTASSEAPSLNASDGETFTLSIQPTGPLPATTETLASKHTELGSSKESSLDGVSSAKWISKQPVPDSWHTDLLGSEGLQSTMDELGNLRSTLESPVPADSEKEQGPSSDDTSSVIGSQQVNPAEAGFSYSTETGLSFSLQPTSLEGTMLSGDVSFQLTKVASAAAEPTKSQSTKVHPTTAQATLEDPTKEQSTNLQSEEVHPTVQHLSYQTTKVQTTKMQPSVTSVLQLSKVQTVEIQTTISSFFQPTKVQLSNIQPTKLTEILDNHHSATVSEQYTPDSSILYASEHAFTTDSSESIIYSSSSLHESDSSSFATPRLSISHKTEELQKYTPSKTHVVLSTVSPSVPEFSQTSGYEFSVNSEYDESERKNATQIQTLPKVVPVSMTTKDQSFLLEASDLATGSTFATVLGNRSNSAFDVLASSTPFAKLGETVDSSFSVVEPTHFVFLVPTVSALSSVMSESETDATSTHRTPLLSLSQPSLSPSALTSSSSSSSLSESSSWSSSLSVRSLLISATDNILSDSGETQTMSENVLHSSSELFTPDSSVGDIVSTPAAGIMSETPALSHSWSISSYGDYLPSSVKNSGDSFAPELTSNGQIEPTSVSNQIYTPEFAESSMVENEYHTIRLTFSTSSISPNSYHSSDSVHLTQKVISSMTMFTMTPQMTDLSPSDAISQHADSVSPIRTLSEETLSVQQYSVVRSTARFAESSTSSSTAESVLPTPTPTAAFLESRTKSASPFNGSSTSLLSQVSHSPESSSASSNTQSSVINYPMLVSSLIGSEFSVWSMSSLDSMQAPFTAFASDHKTLRYDLSSASPVETSSPGMAISSSAVETNSSAMETSSSAMETSSFATETSSPAIETSSSAMETSSYAMEPSSSAMESSSSAVTNEVPSEMLSRSFSPSRSSMLTVDRSAVSEELHTPSKVGVMTTLTKVASALSESHPDFLLETSHLEQRMTDSATADFSPLLFSLTKSDSEIGRMTTPLLTSSSWLESHAFSPEASDFENGLMMSTSSTEDFSQLPTLSANLESKSLNEPIPSVRSTLLLSPYTTALLETQQSTSLPVTSALNASENTAILALAPTIHSGISMSSQMITAVKESEMLSPTPVFDAMQTLVKTSSNVVSSTITKPATFFSNVQESSTSAAEETSSVVPDTAIRPSAMLSDVQETSASAAEETSSVWIQSSDVSTGISSSALRPSHVPITESFMGMDSSDLTPSLPEFTRSMVYGPATMFLTSSTLLSSAASEASPEDTTLVFEDLSTPVLQVKPTNVHSTQSVTSMETVLPSQTQSATSDVITPPSTSTPDVTRPSGETPSSFLRIQIKVDFGVDVTSPGFLEWIKQALIRLYLAALQAQDSATSSSLARQRRQAAAEEVQAQVLDVQRDPTNSSVVSLDFSITENEQRVSADTALSALKTLTHEQMSVIIKYPVISLSREVSVNGTLTVGDPTDSSAVIITKGGIEFVLPKPTLTTTFTVSLPTTLSMSPTSASSLPTVPVQTSLSSLTASVSSEYSSLTLDSTMPSISATFEPTVPPSPSSDTFASTFTIVFPTSVDKSSELLQTSSIATSVMYSESASLLPTLASSDLTPQPSTTVFAASSETDIIPMPSSISTSSEPVSSLFYTGTPELSETSIVFEVSSNSSPPETSTEAIPTSASSIIIPVLSSFSSEEVSSSVASLLSSSVLSASDFNSISEVLSLSSTSLLPPTTESFYSSTPELSSSFEFSSVIVTLSSLSVADTELTNTFSRESTAQPSSVPNSKSVEYPFSEDVTSQSVAFTSEIQPTYSSALETELPETTQTVSSLASTVATDSMPVSPSLTFIPLPTFTMSTMFETTPVMSTSSAVQPPSSATSETSTTLIISPSPTMSTTTPSSSVTPTTSPSSTTTPPEKLRDALMVIDIEVKVTEDEQSEEFKDQMRTGLALVYREALVSRKKRSPPADDFIQDVRHLARSRRQAETNVTAEVTDVTRNSTNPRVTNVTFYVTEDGNLVPAGTASVTFNKFSPNEISAIIAYPVVSSYVRPVYAVQPTQSGDFDNGVGMLFVVAIVLPSILLIFLLVVLSIILVRACRAPPPASPADVVPTKYQRGESLDDYNLHVDVERGEIVDLTPHPTPDPNFRRLSKSKSGHKPDFAAFQSSKEDTLDSKRHMIDKWLQGDHARPRGSVESVKSMAQSDTFLYSKHRPSRGVRQGNKERRKSKHLEVPQEPYKEYLKALRLPESDLDEREGESGEHDRSRESFAMEERNVDEDQQQQQQQQRSPSPSKDPPQARPRTSFVGKLRKSIRKRSTTPEYNTQSTMLSALADSAQTLPGSHDASVDHDEAREHDTQHTDASDEFTVFVPMSRGTSRESMCTSPVITIESEEKDSGEHENLSSSKNKAYLRSKERQDSETPTKRTPSMSNLKQTRQEPMATLDRGVQTVDSSKDSLHAGDEWTLLLDARPVRSQEELSKDGCLTSTRTMQTQTSFASSSDISTDSDITLTPGVKVKSVAVGRNTVNVRTQTSKEGKRPKPKRKTGRPAPTHISAPSNFPSAASTEKLLQSDASMEEELEEEFAPMKVEPFAKMSQIHQPHDKDTTLPVKYRRNVFEESPGSPAEDDAVQRGPDIQVQSHYKPARHMRAQPRVMYSAMDPEQRKQIELLDTAVARQQLLLQQQQEVLTYAHQQQLEQQAQHIINSSLTNTTTTTAAARNPQQQHRADHDRLSKLLNEACILAPHQGVPRASAGGAHWMTSQMPRNNQAYYNPVLPNAGMLGAAIPPPGAPSPWIMGHDELMQAVRKELKRMQQE